MNPELDLLLRQLEPAAAATPALRLRFGLACVERVEHLLEHADALAGLAAFRTLVAQRAYDGLAALAPRLEAVANAHQGSRSLDGVGHAAVSATYALANAVAGRARQAADYAAYASVYGQGGYGATSDPASFEPERAWQVLQLRRLLDGPPA
ncbi:MAG: hypothetical protein JO224_03435 [Pelomonas sp.]|nr:hypothetical protein [Roseateles sp.]